MRFKTMMFVIAVLCMTFSVAIAKTPEKSAPYRVPGQDVPVRAYFEGFEGAFPPVGWTHTITNPSNTWIQDPSAFEGNYAARVMWQAGFPQNEGLHFSHLIDSSINEDHLIFASMGSISWCTSADLTVHINGVQVWDFCSSASASWVWEQFDIDLSAYDGTTVDISFIYAGDDGADCHLDAVEIAEGYTPPEPPVNNTCAGVIDIQAQGLVTWDVDLTLATNDFTTGTPSCTGYSANGLDVVYSIDLIAGETFTASQQGGHDSAIYLLADCYDMETCVVGADATLSGEVESITWVCDVDGTYYLVIDGYSGGGLTTVWIDNPIATEGATWGSVKSLYR